MMTGAIVGGKSVEQAARLQSESLPRDLDKVQCKKYS